MVYNPATKYELHQNLALASNAIGKPKKGTQSGPHRLTQTQCVTPIAAGTNNRKIGHEETLQCHRVWQEKFRSIGNRAIQRLLSGLQPVATIARIRAVDRFQENPSDPISHVALDMRPNRGSHAGTTEAILRLDRQNLRSKRKPCLVAQP